MDPNELQELRELVEFLKANEIAEFDLEKNDLKVRLKFLGAVKAEAPASGGLDMAQLARLMASAPAAAPVATIPAQVAHAHPAAPAEAAPPAPLAETLHVVKSPIVGTFYESPSPGSPAFVKVGDVVEVGQVLCIVEAMKLMNEIESDAAGEIVERVAASAQPVEYGQPLFKIRAR
jgi:acetyl-CoA carboxylase biotin carboxyl carrier protein